MTTRQSVAILLNPQIYDTYIIITWYCSHKSVVYYVVFVHVLGTTDYHFQAHMNSHFEHQCPHCDYKSRTEGRLKRHIKGKSGSAAVPSLIAVASFDVIDTWSRSTSSMQG